MLAIGDIAGYFIDIGSHGFSVHLWRRDRRTRSARRADSRFRNTGRQVGEMYPSQ